MIKHLIKRVLNSLDLEYKYGSIRNKRILKNSNNYKLYHKKVHTVIEGNDLIAQRLKSEDPFLAARIGSSELSVVLNYLHFASRRIIWSEYLRDEIWRQSGVFPPDDKTLKKFSEIYLEAIAEVDIMGVWNNDGEEMVIKKFCPKASLIPLESIEPYFFEEPWSRYLIDKKVLVIHPFEESIKYQYENNREHLFANSKVLPAFKLITLKAIQTQVFNSSSFESWFDVFEKMKKEIIKADFDVAIIGAGAYGLPLGAYIKKLGKKAVHMGGATQILFGIKGKRWEDRENFKLFFNSFWKNPFPSEKPQKANLLEGGAYW